MRKFIALLALVGLLVSVSLAIGFSVKQKDGSNFPQYSITVTQGTIGTTAAALARECIRMTVKALNGNSGFVYLGDSGVTPDKGFELDASEEITIDSYTYGGIYIVGSAAGQKYVYICYN